MALGIITKEKQGLVCLNAANNDELKKIEYLQDEQLKIRLDRTKELAAKRKQRLIELFTQYLSIKKLMKRNSQVHESKTKIGLPFILIELSKFYFYCIDRGSNAEIKKGLDNKSLILKSKKPFLVKDENNLLSKLNFDKYFLHSNILELMMKMQI